MERIINQNHDRHTFIYACSKLLERAAFYGVRFLIVLYMTGDSIQMSREQALIVFSWFTGGFIVSHIIGGILGDLVFGNKRALIIGGAFQAIGAFSLCMHTPFGLYAGLGLIVLGGGLYTPNVTAQFGKLYLPRDRLLDSGFAIFYTAINIGSFVGVLLIGYLGENFGWSIGFMSAGGLMLISIALPALSQITEPVRLYGDWLPRNQIITKIVVAVVLVGLFWAIYDLYNIRMPGLLVQVNELATLDNAGGFWLLISNAFFVPVSIAAIVLWSYFYSGQFTKLTIGFAFAAISLGVLSLIPGDPNESHLILYLIAMMIFDISEIHIGPVINSLLTQYTNPKYLATVMSLAFIPGYLISYGAGSFSGELYDRPFLALKLALVAMSVISVGLIIYLLQKKQGATITKEF